MESPTELFIKKLFIQWLPHSAAFELLNKNPPKQVHAISTVYHLIPSFEMTPRDMKPVVNN